MNGAGIAFMAISWGLIIALNLYCLLLLSRNKD